jgi:hypothetical protein
VLAVPIVDVDGAVFAVMQLLNKDGGVPFPASDEDKIRSFASQVGVILEAWVTMSHGRLTRRTPPRHAVAGRAAASAVLRLDQGLAAGLRSARPTTTSCTSSGWGSRRYEAGHNPRAFPNVGEQFIVKLFRTTESVRKATGVNFSLHDLRATCATGVRRVSGLPHVPALVLGHQGVPGVPDVTSRYDRADTVPEVAAGLNAWAAHIEGLLREKPTADVVPIGARRKRESA